MWLRNRWLRKWKSGVLVLAVVVSALIPSVSLAYQSEWETGRIPDFVSSTYKGWAYVSTSAATTATWKWTATGWQAASWTAGQSVYAYPFSGAWHWAYTGGTWYAIKSSELAVWSCAPQGSLGTRVLAADVPVFARNTATSTLLGYARGKAGEGPICENMFPDAAIGHTVFVALPPCAPGVNVACAPIPSPLMLVRITVDPCVTATGRIAGCTTALKVVQGYIRTNDVFDYL